MDLHPATRFIQRLRELLRPQHAAAVAQLQTVIGETDRDKLNAALVQMLPPPNADLADVDRLATLIVVARSIANPIREMVHGTSAREALVVEGATILLRWEALRQAAPATSPPAAPVEGA